MKFQEALAQKGITIDDLPKSQQKKISEVLLSKERIEQMEDDIDDESREEFENIKTQLNQADEELVVFIRKFDVEKARIQRERLAEMRNRKKAKQEDVEPEVEPEAEQEEKQVEQPKPPVLPNEQSISEHIQELRKEAQIVPDDFEEDLVEQYSRERYVPKEPIEVEAEEFEKQSERKPRKVNVPLVIMGVGALLLTWGAVNFFKERK